MSARFKSDQEILNCRYGVMESPYGRKPGKRAFSRIGSPIAAAGLALLLLAWSLA